MPRQVYRCPKHGEFELTVPVGDDVQKAVPCPAILGYKQIGDRPMEALLCDEVSPWVPSVPNFIGGPTTGAKKE
jgi:hypothetical protein